MRKGYILIAEDDPDIVELLKLRFEIRDFDVTTAYDGKEVLEKVHKRKPDLILLDVSMPKMDGFEVCKVLKSDKRYKNIPIFILTARTHKSSREKGMSLKVEEYITKPFDLNMLVDKVERRVAS